MYVPKKLWLIMVLVKQIMPLRECLSFWDLNSIVYSLYKALTVLQVLISHSWSHIKIVNSHTNLVTGFIAMSCLCDKVGWPLLVLSQKQKTREHLYISNFLAVIWLWPKPVWISIGLAIKESVHHICSLTLAMLSCDLKIFLLVGTSPSDECILVENKILIKP